MNAKLIRIIAITISVAATIVGGFADDLAIKEYCKQKDTNNENTES